MLFLSRRFSRVRSATASFSADASCRRSLTSGLVAWRAFYTEWEPQLQNRFGNLLLQILNTKFEGESLKFSRTFMY